MFARRTAGLVVLLVAVSVVLAACGGGGESGTPPPVAPPVETDATSTTSAGTETDVPPPTSPGAETVAPSTAPAEEQIVALARAWYAEADPAVCDHMTEAMLGHGWGVNGETGRNECRKLVGASDPAVDAVVGSPTVEGNKATVEVTYGPPDGRRVDRLDFVLVNGEWQVDNLALVGSAGATDTVGA